MKKLIIFIIVILILAWLAQNYTSFKTFDYAKKINWGALWSNIKAFKLPSLNFPQATIPPADKQLNVFIRDSKFLPNFNAIQKGAKVTWYNENDKTHNVTGEGWDSGAIVPGKTFSKVFDVPGIYKYHCSIHPEMTGEIMVE